MLSSSLKYFKYLILFLLGSFFSFTYANPSETESVETIQIQASIKSATETCDGFNISSFLHQNVLDHSIQLVDDQNKSVATIFSKDNFLVVKGEKNIKYCLHGDNFPNLFLMANKISFSHFKTIHSVQIFAETGDILLIGTADQLATLNIKGNKILNQALLHFKTVIVESPDFTNKGLLDAEDGISLITKTFYNHSSGDIIAKNYLWFQGEEYREQGKIVVAGICYFDADIISIYPNSASRGIRCEYLNARAKQHIELSNSSFIGGYNIKLFAHNEILFSGLISQTAEVGERTYMREKGLKLGPIHTYPRFLDSMDTGHGVEIISNGSITKSVNSHLDTQDSIVYSAPKISLDGKTSSSPYKKSSIKIIAENSSSLIGTITSGGNIHLFGNTEITGIVKAAESIKQQSANKITTKDSAVVSAGDKISFSAKIGYLDGQLTANSIETNTSDLFMHAKTIAPTQTYTGDRTTISNSAEIGAKSCSVYGSECAEIFGQQHVQNLTIGSAGQTTIAGDIDSKDSIHAQGNNVTVSGNANSKNQDYRGKTGQFTQHSSTTSEETTTIDFDQFSLLDGKHEARQNFVLKSKEGLTNVNGTVKAPTSEFDTDGIRFDPNYSYITGEKTTIKAKHGAELGPNNIKEIINADAGQGILKINQPIETKEADLSGSNIELNDKVKADQKLTMNALNDIDAKRGKIESEKIFLSSKMGNIHFHPYSAVVSYGDEQELSLRANEGKILLDGMISSQKITDLVANDIKMSSGSTLETYHLIISGNNWETEKGSTLSSQVTTAKLNNDITLDGQIYLGEIKALKSKTGNIEIRGDVNANSGALKGKKIQIIGSAILSGGKIALIAKDDINIDGNVKTKSLDAHAQKGIHVRGQVNAVSQYYVSDHSNVHLYPNSKTVNYTGEENTIFINAEEGKAILEGIASSSVLQIIAKNIENSSTSKMNTYHLFIRGDTWDTHTGSLLTAQQTDTVLKEDVNLNGSAYLGNITNLESTNGSINISGPVSTEHGTLKGKNIRILGSALLDGGQLVLIAKEDVIINGEIASETLHVNAKKMVQGADSNTHAEKILLNADEIENNGNIDAKEDLDIFTKKYTQGTLAHLGFNHGSLISDSIDIDGMIDGKSHFKIIAKDGTIKGQITANENILEIPVLDLKKGSTLNGDSISVTSEQRLSADGNINGTKEIFIKVHDNYIPAGVLSTQGWVKLSGSYNQEECESIIENKHDNIHAQGHGFSTDQEIEFKKDINSTHGISAIAKGLKVNANIKTAGDLELESTQEDLDLGHVRLEAGQKLELKSERNMTCNGTKIYGQATSLYVKKDLIQKHFGEKGSYDPSEIKSRGTGTKIKTMIADRDENGKVIYDQNKKPRYHEEEIDVGLYIDVGGKYTNIASTLSSEGSAIINAKDGMEFIPHSYMTETSTEHKKKRWGVTYGKDIETTRTSHCENASVQAKGHLILNGGKGSIEMTATTLKGEAGTQMQAEKDIKCFDYVSSNEKTTRKKGFLRDGKFTLDKTTKKSNGVSFTSVIVDDTSIAIDTDGEVYARGTFFITPGTVSVRGKEKVTIDQSILNNKIEIDEKSLGLYAPGLDLMKKLYQAGKANNAAERNRILAEADPFVSQMVRASNSAFKQKDLLGAVVNADGLYKMMTLDTLKNKASIGLTASHDHQEISYQTTGGGGIYAGGLQLVSDNEVIFNNGVDVEVANDADINCSDFIQRGACLNNSSSSSHEAITGSYNPLSDPTALTLSGEISQSDSKDTQWHNQRFSVGKKLNVFANTWNMDAANTSSGSLGGHVDNMIIKSEKDTHYQKSSSKDASITLSFATGVPIPTGGGIGLGNGYEAEEVVSQMSGLNIANAGGGFSVGTKTKLIGAIINAQEIWDSKEVESEDIHTSKRGNSTHIGLSTTANTGTASFSYNENPNKSEVFRATISGGTNAQKVTGNLNGDLSKAHEVLSEDRGRNMQDQFTVDYSDLKNLIPQSPEIPAKKLHPEDNRPQTSKASQKQEDDESQSSNDNSKDKTQKQDKERQVSQKKPESSKHIGPVKSNVKKDDDSSNKKKSGGTDIADDFGISSTLNRTEFVTSNPQDYVTKRSPAPSKSKTTTTSDAPTKKETPVAKEKSAFSEAINFASDKFCFIKNTYVLTVDGYTPIQDIKVGDKVLSCNLNSEHCNYDDAKEVSFISTRAVNSIVKIEFEDGQTISSTPEHPYYLVEEETWVPAEELRTGDEILTHEGTVITITKTDYLEDHQADVYNIEVNDNHNYYVSCNDELSHGVLVHNCDIKKDHPFWSDVLKSAPIVSDFNNAQTILADNDCDGNPISTQQRWEAGVDEGMNFVPVANIAKKVYKTYKAINTAKNVINQVKNSANNQGTVPQKQTASSVDNKATKIDHVDLTDKKGRTHILDGDKKGGGHRAGTGNPEKSEFPKHWNDDKVIHEISDVATDPKAVHEPGKWNTTISKGTRDGVDVEVIHDGKRVITGYPTNQPRNPK